MKQKLSEKKWYNGAVIACIGVTLYVVLTHLGPIRGAIQQFLGNFKAIFLALVIAYVLNPLAKFFYYIPFKKLKASKTRWSISVVLAVIAALLVVGLIMGMVIPQLVQSLTLFSTNIDQYSASLLALIEGSPLEHFVSTDQMKTLSENAIGTITSFIRDNAGKILNAAANSGKNIVTVVLSSILAIYFLSGKEGFRSGFRRMRHAFMTDRAYKTHTAFWKKCHEILIRYIGFDMLDGIIVGVINAIFMVIARMPYVSLISVVVGVTNLVPTFGPVIGAVIGAFILVLVDPMQALIFLIFTMVLQLIDGYILKPKMFGGSLGVPAAWILISIVVGGKLFGIPGIVLGIPFAAIISFVYEELVMPMLLKHKAKREQRELEEKE